MLKKTFYFIITLLALGIIVHYLPSLPVKQPALPAINEIENFIYESEKQFDDVIDGAEKTIVWAGDKNRKTEFAVVYLHGYSATRQESAPLSDLLAQELNANAYHIRLTGHGRGNKNMVHNNLRAWKQDALEAYQIAKTIGDKIIIVSVSTGATLSTWLAAREDTDAIVAQLMISPNFDVPNKSAYMIDLPLGIGVKLAEWTAGKNHTWTPKNELQEKYWSTNHPLKSVRPMVQLLKEIKKIDKSSLTVPTLMVYSEKDTVISIPAIKENFTSLGSIKKKLVAYNDSEDTHVLASEIVSPNDVKPVLKILLDFLYDNKIAPQSLNALQSKDTEIQPDNDVVVDGHNKPGN